MTGLPLASPGPAVSDRLHLQQCVFLLQIRWLKTVGPAPGMWVARERDLVGEC